MSAVNVAGSRRTGSLPCGSDPVPDVLAAWPCDPLAHPFTPRAPIAARTRTRRQRSVAAVGRAADDCKVLIDLHIHQVVVVEGDLDLVVALLVPEPPPSCGPPPWGTWQTEPVPGS